MCSQLPTAADKDAYDQLKSSKLNAETHPNLYAWFCLVAKFTDAVRGAWTGAGSKGGDKKAAAPKKEEAPKKDDDEMDLFGDDDDDEVSLLFNRRL